MSCVCVRMVVDASTWQLNEQRRKKNPTDYFKGKGG